MTRQEFDERCKKHEQITNEEYKVIEFVYTHHPSIDELLGKKQIAMLVDTFGMRIIYDMYPTAQKASEYFNKIQKLRIELGHISDEYNEFIKGNI